MVSKVLVAFDESPQAHTALHHALSTYSDATITALHVTDPREWADLDGVGGAYFSKELLDQAQESAEDLMTEAEAIAKEYGKTISTATETGQPASSIVDYAEENGFDHIVLGSHGRSGISRFLLGSVAETVAERAHISVTIIREEDTARSDA